MTTSRSTSDIQSEAKAALYLAAKEAADVVKAAIELNEENKGTGGADFTLIGKDRVDAALKLLEIAWLSK